MCDSRKSNNCEFIEYAMTNYLNPSARLELKIRPFPWNFVPDYLEKHLKDIFDDFELKTSFRLIFVEALKNHPCENRAIFTAITDIYILISLQVRDYSDIFGARKQGQLEMILSHLKQGDGQSIFSDQECIPIVEVLNGGLERFMQILATHGCYADLSDDSSFARRQASVMIGRFLKVIYEKGSQSPLVSRAFRRYFRNGEDDLLYSFLRREYVAVKLHLDFSWSLPDPNEVPHSRISPLIIFFLDPSTMPEGFSVKRLFLVSLGLNILSLKLEGYRRPPRRFRDYLSESVKSLEIYFRTITEPYLNVTEVRKLLTGCIFEESKSHLLDQWCKDFEDVIPFCTKNYEPRKLSHLCRCQVRQNYYGSGSTLCSVIDKLNVPKVIKDFLLCRPLTKNPVLSRTFV